jgi:prolyl-tRNA synthetase
MSDQVIKNDEKALTTRAGDFNQWYQEVIAIAELAEHGPSKGSMIIKPYGYALWENIQRVLDGKFKEVGVENAYFPLLIPESFLNREKEHVEGFAPELAVVTMGGGKELEEPLVIRPTSETIMYDAYSRWIKSYRDLPLLINQWANVVRWEMRPRLFLRSTEFLWQEGHTVHETAEEADAFSRKMLEVYKKFLIEYLAITPVDGEKSATERFAGAAKTYTIEAMMQDGKALQSGTSHYLADHFAKVFGVKFLNRDNQEQFGEQTSWGVSTRLIGGLIMAHSDDKGLVLPPKIAPIQIVIIPIGKDEEKKAVLENTEKISAELIASGLTVKIDKTEGRPGQKFFLWEAKGVPVRLELGPKDMANKSVVAVRRDTGEKIVLQQSELVVALPKLLSEIQDNLLKTYNTRLTENTVKVNTWEDFKIAIENSKFVMAHWDGTAETEAAIKEQTNATIRCLPFAEPAESGKCVFSGKPSKSRVLFAKAY